MTDKTLLLIRHAKSDWHHASTGDFDRPLAARGEAAAPVMAAHLREKGWVPDLVLCSAALRTRLTWQLMDATLASGADVREERTLYEASPHTLLDVIRSGGGAAATLAVVGHHPGIDGAALMLSGTGDRRAMDRIRTKFPTAAVAVVRIPLDSWSALAPGIGELQAFVTPKDLQPA